jgi:hypothetical protein
MKDFAKIWEKNRHQKVILMFGHTESASTPCCHALTDGLALPGRRQKPALCLSEKEKRRPLRSASGPFPLWPVSAPLNISANTISVSAKPDWSTTSVARAYSI